jgi:4-amino-4-deoxy-L-arabinose transferase-like glycosyltransferase
MQQDPIATAGARSHGWPTAVAAAAVILGLYLFIASRSTLWDRDEPRFAQATVEMLRSGNYLYPTFNGTLRPDKPIMIYWMMSLAVRLCGANEIGFRFVGSLSIALAALGTYWIGRRILSARAAFWSMLVLAVSPLAVVPGTAATTDALLLAIFVAAMATHVHSFEKGFTLRHALLFGLLCACALLTKGPVGIGVPLLGAIGTWSLGRGVLTRGPRAKLFTFGSAVLGCAIFLSWGIPANNATISRDYPSGEYLQTGLGHHVVDRTSRPMEHHGGNFVLMLPFYLPAVLLGFLPWSLFLFTALSRCWRGECGGDIGKALIFGWSVPTFALMSVVATKMPHYILPIWPALALAVGATLDAAQSGTLTERDMSRIKWGAWLALLLASAAGVAVIVVPRHFPAEALKTPAALCGAAIIACSIAGLVLIQKQRIVDAARFFPAAAAGLALLAGTTLLPAIESCKLTQRMAGEINAKIPADVPVVTCRYDEPSLILYLRRGVIEDLRTAKELTAWFEQRTPGILVMDRPNLLQFQKDKKVPPNVEEIISVKGFDVYSKEFYTKGESAELVAIKR